MKTKAKPLNAFTFWKDNKLNGLFTLSIIDLQKRWLAWLEINQNPNTQGRGLPWYYYYFGEKAVRAFITDAEALGGLQSVSEEAQFEQIYNAVKPLF